jgi:hypothetical protein
MPMRKNCINRNTLRRLFPHITIPKGKEGKPLTDELSIFVSSTIMGCGYEARDFSDYLEFARDHPLVSTKHWAEFYNAHKENNMWAVIEKERFAYFKDGIRKGPWKALGSLTPKPEQKKEKEAPSSEDRMMYAFEHGTVLAEEFLKYFEQTANRVFGNYKRLATEQGVLEQFETNPLVTIVTMQPSCCFHIATKFLADKMTG